MPGLAYLLFLVTAASIWTRNCAADRRDHSVRGSLQRAANAALAVVTSAATISAGMALGAEVCLIGNYVLGAIVCACIVAAFIALKGDLEKLDGDDWKDFLKQVKHRNKNFQKKLVALIPLPKIYPAP